MTGERARTSPHGLAEFAHHEHQRFDVLRGLMAIIVLLQHVSQILLWRLFGPESRAAITGDMAGRQAVIVFFLLSGYLITRSIRSNIVRHKSFSVREYATARLARIYPPLIGAILLCLLVWVVLQAFGLPGGTRDYGLPGDLYLARDRFIVTAKGIGDALLMRDGLLGADGPLWTLSIEFHLYMAALILAAPRISGFLTRAMCIVIGAAGLFLIIGALPLALVWFIGAAFALWPVGRKTGFALALAAAVPTAAILLLSPELFGSRMDTQAGLIAMQAPAVMLAAVIFAVPPRWRYSRALVRTGDYSYSLYVIHWPLLLLALSLTQQWTQHSLWRAGFVGIGSILVILPLSMLFASVAEKPKLFARWLRGVLPKRPGEPPALSALAPPLQDRT